ncbi:hypothetical protein Pelo_13701 [Pelomyxa schiedti]|nr:hypothetical protein Pelo_13701 [Pelomyxa schiedti]
MSRSDASSVPDVDVTIRSMSPSVPEFTIRVSVNLTVGDVKTLVSAREAEPIDTASMKLIYAGRVLPDASILSDVFAGRDLNSPQVVHLVVRPIERPVDRDQVPDGRPGFMPGTPYAPFPTGFPGAMPPFTGYPLPPGYPTPPGYPNVPIYPPPPASFQQAHPQMGFPPQQPHVPPPPPPHPPTGFPPQHTPPYPPPPGYGPPPGYTLPPPGYGVPPGYAPQFGAPPMGMYGGAYPNLMRFPQPDPRHVLVQRRRLNLSSIVWRIIVIFILCTTAPTMKTMFLLLLVAGVILFRGLFNFNFGVQVGVNRVGPNAANHPQAPNAVEPPANNIPLQPRTGADFFIHNVILPFFYSILPFWEPREHLAPAAQPPPQQPPPAQPEPQQHPHNL